MSGHLGRSFTTLVLLALALPGASGAPPPQRIVSTSPGITEILFALGLGPRVVGVTQYCKYPPEVARIPRIGTWTTPNMEVILAARPDLIVVQRTAVHDSTRFRTLKLRTLEVHLDRVADIHTTIDAIGAVAGVPAEARALNAKIRADLDAIRARVASKPATGVLFVVGRTPGTLEGIIAVGPKSYLSEVISLAGGLNILADSPVAYPKVLHEEIVARSPDVIIDIVDMGEPAGASPSSDAQRRREVALYNRYPTLGAVRNKRVHILGSEVFMVPGPRVVECARQIARLLHPEAFR